MADEPTDQQNAVRSPFSPLLEHAIELSAQWHDHTYRKSRWRGEAFEVPPDDSLGVPVVAHLTAVALTLQRAGWDDATVAAGFLHDIVEDRNRWKGRFTPESLESVMGPEVMRLVMHVSETKYDAQGRPRAWRERKEDYINGLRTAPDRAVAISLADKLHNLWTINESLGNGVDVFSADTDRQPLHGAPDEQLWLVNEVLSAADGRQDPRLASICQQLRAEIERFCLLAGVARQST